MFFSRSEVLKHLSEGNVVSADMFKCLLPKKLAIKLTQASTSDPTAVVVHSDVGVLTLARTGTGVYTVVAAGQFTLDKTILPTNTSRITFVHTDVDTITISTFSADLATAADVVLSATPLNVEIWD